LLIDRPQISAILGLTEGCKILTTVSGRRFKSHDFRLGEPLTRKSSPLIKREASQKKTKTDTFLQKFHDNLDSAAGFCASSVVVLYLIRGLESLSTGFKSWLELHLNRGQPNFFEFAIRFKCSNGAQGSSAAEKRQYQDICLDWRLRTLPAEKGNDASVDVHRQFGKKAAPGHASAS
jgi:hypothetical protein